VEEHQNSLQAESRLKFVVRESELIIEWWEVSRRYFLRLDKFSTVSTAGEKPLAFRLSVVPPDWLIVFYTHPVPSWELVCYPNKTDGSSSLTWAYLTAVSDLEAPNEFLSVAILLSRAGALFRCLGLLVGSKGVLPETNRKTVVSTIQGLNVRRQILPSV